MPGVGVRQHKEQLVVVVAAVDVDEHVGVRADLLPCEVTGRHGVGPAEAGVAEQRVDVDQIAAGARLEVEHRVDALQVEADLPDELVDAPAAVELIGAGAAEQNVVAAFADDHVVAGLAPQHIVCSTIFDTSNFTDDIPNLF